MPEKKLNQKINQPFKSSAKNKKYSVYVKDNGDVRLIHFGDKRYEHYKDRIGKFSHLDHGDKQRRKNYRARHEGIKLSDGSRAIDNKSSPAYWSYKYLW